MVCGGLSRNSCRALLGLDGSETRPTRPVVAFVALSFGAYSESRRAFLGLDGRGRPSLRGRWWLCQRLAARIGSAWPRRPAQREKYPVLVRTVNPVAFGWTTIFRKVWSGAGWVG
jgi:hypothetical protein